jgi:hypothetical protein
MLHTKKLLDQLNAMKHSPVHNYAIPGLTSWVIGAPSKDQGMVRLFENERQHYEPITPHSHRFDFTAQVLKGRVRNILWEQDKDGDLYQLSTLRYCGETGKYEGQSFKDVMRFSPLSADYTEGQVYSMTGDQIHSIYFDRGTVVLFLEGPKKSNYSSILQPVVDGELIPTFKVEDWMFKRT